MIFLALKKNQMFFYIIIIIFYERSIAQNHGIKLQSQKLKALLCYKALMGIGLSRTLKSNPHLAIRPTIYVKIQPIVLKSSPNSTHLSDLYITWDPCGSFSSSFSTKLSCYLCSKLALSGKKYFFSFKNPWNKHLKVGPPFHNFKGELVL